MLILSDKLMKSKILCLILLFQLTLTLAPLLPISTLATSNSPIIVEPGESIQEAVNNAAEGQTIYIKKGVYKIETDILINKTLTLIGEDSKQTIIDGQNTTTLILNILADNTKIQNLTIRSAEKTCGIGVQIKDATNVEIKNNHIKNCSIGIKLRNANYSTIKTNSILNNTCGILLEKSYHNQIHWNNIDQNVKSIIIKLGSSENTFYQNNLNQIDGWGVPENFWNTTYPMGGNHWTNYLGFDLKKGPDQNETGSDGIGDEEYELSLGAKDHYPIIGLIQWYLAYKSENIEYYVIISNNASEVLSFNFNPNKSLIQFTLAGVPVESNKTNLCRVQIPQQLMWTQTGSWEVTVDNTNITYTFTSDKNYTYLCFMYNYSDAKTVKIKGTHSIPEFSSNIIIVLTIIATFIIGITVKFKNFSLETNSRKFKNLKDP